VSKVGFSIKALDTYEWPVDVKVPIVDPATKEGGHEVHRFTGKFKHLSLTESRALIDKLNTRVASDTAGFADIADPAAMQLQVAALGAEYQIALYSEIWLGWGPELTDEHGDPLAYSDDMKRKLLEERIIRDAVMEAHRLSQGGEAVRQKN
jgi:hypothetical protein